MPNIKLQIKIAVILFTGILFLNPLKINSQNAVKIGVALPMFSDSEDGSKKQLGNEILDGIKFALQEYSKGAPVKVTLEVMDTKRDPVLASDIIRSFGEDESIIGVIGPVFSSELSESALNGPQFSLPIISPTATGDELAANYNYVFQLNPSYEVRGKLMADYLIKKNGLKNFAVIYEESYGDNFRKHFETEVKTMGGKVVIAQSYPKNPQNITEQIGAITKYIRENDMFINAANLNLTQKQKLELSGVRWSLIDSSVSLNMDVSIYYMFGVNAKKILDTMNIKPYKLKPETTKYIQGVIDAIYIPIANPNEISIIVPQLFSDGLGMYIAGTGDWNHDKALEDNKVYLKNVVFESEYFPDETKLNELKENLKKTKYKISKNFLFGYDTGKLLFRLIGEGADTRQELNASLKNLVNYDAIKSKISLDYHGINSELNILRYDDGIKLVETYKLSK
ncbi:MAG TPA: penicillin-binding protein activator [Ignavibacteria bacterium]|nr:penicillin-binding protein activator [Ignavibacteria bacterium]HRF65291.1 penicillin-binding protein activator [Ignavibacteria bacterium]HRJ05193.1 penicillin-binding protein activator [Ignavibacteria bacterium]